MYTIDQVKAAHSKVKSGADFPAYIQDLIELGVTGYETYVSDGHCLYFGKDNFEIQSPAKYDELVISKTSDQDRFIKELKDHQQGKTNYPEFCRMSAETGIEKWVVNMSEMTCNYYDQTGKEILSELIPSQR